MKNPKNIIFKRVFFDGSNQTTARENPTRGSGGIDPDTNIVFNILDKKEFPEYFTDFKDFESFIDGWLSFSEEI